MIPSKKVKRVTLATTIASTFLCCLLVTGTSSADSSKLKNGEYHAGVVLIYQEDDQKFVVATPDKIDYEERNYVLIHGANSKIEAKKALEIAQTIRKQDQKGNILAVDWSCFANFNEARVDDIITEQIQELITEILGVLVVEVITEEDMNDKYEEIFQKNLSKLATRVFANLMAIEQTLYIPLTADRANSLLFGKKETQWEFTTNGEKATFVSLGLDPKATHLIGHSHGAHVAGMICTYCKQEYGRQVDRLTALEPSPHQIHISEENKDGNGWNANAARYVDSYKTSLFFSSDKLYGDFNFEARMSDHPLNQIESIDSPEDMIATLLSGFKTELSLHSVVVDLFISLVENDDLLEIEPEPQEEWIVEEY